MWLDTIEGSFSIVRKPGETLITVRARARSDLERLRERYLAELGPIQAGGGTDYPFRARVEAAALGRAAAAMVEGIRYSNFKAAVGKELGHERETILHDVWDARRQITATEPAVARADAYGGVLIDQRGQVLLREPTGHFGGYVWTFPKGRHRATETPEATALREVREETGVEAAIVRAIPELFPGDTSTTAFFLMRPLADHGDFDRKETNQVRWVTPDEARRLIATTQSTKGRARDLAVLEAALGVLDARG